MGYRFGMLFNGFGVMFTIMFVIVTGTIIFTLVKGIAQWNKNNNSPRLTVPATVVTKRTKVSRHSSNGADDFHDHTTTTYYVTFQVKSGDRMELRVTGTEYGMLVEGDNGELTFQGTRYLGFDRR